MPFIFANLASTTLASPLASGGTSLTLASTANWPAITSGQIFPIVLVDAATQSVAEIVYGTARTGAVVTVVRAQEGTTAQSWAAGDFCYNSLTAAEAASFAPGNGSGAVAIDVSSSSQTKVGTLATGGLSAPSLNIGASGANIGGPTSITGTLSAAGAASLANTTVSGTLSATGTISSSGNVSGISILGGNGAFTNSLTCSQPGGFSCVGATQIDGTVISGGNGSPSQINGNGNYVTIAGVGASTGVDFSNANTGAVIVRFVSGSTTEAFVANNGVYTTVSDAREKKNVVRITGALGRLLKLKPSWFDWKKTDAPDLGFIAQEVKRVIPEAVSKNDGRYYLADRPVLATAVAAIQEQHAIIVAQQKQIDALTKAVQKLQAR